MCPKAWKRRALRWATKHSQVTIVSVELTKEGLLVGMVTEGNGRELDVGTVLGRKCRHFDATIKRERAQSVNGAVEIRSHPGEGTRVVARIPLEDWRR